MEKLHTEIMAVYGLLLMSLSVTRLLVKLSLTIAFHLHRNSVLDGQKKPLHFHFMVGTAQHRKILWSDLILLSRYFIFTKILVAEF